MINAATPTAPPLWKASVCLKKAEAGNIAALFEISLPRPQAVLISEDPFRDEAEVEALYDRCPDGDLLSQLSGRDVRIVLLPDQDWIKLSHEGLPPVRAGRFFVFGAHDAGCVPPSVIPIRIDAGMAFGTGHHETTALCLSEMSNLARRRHIRKVLDLGCGSGILAIGAAKLFNATVIACDIDPTAVVIAKANVRDNCSASSVSVVQADGPSRAAVAARGGFDLILANILAAPLTLLAPQICDVLVPGGTAILSGLLTGQENLVLSFYRQRGLRLRKRARDGAWSALVLERVGHAR
jgi:ribosomal protein L11 methyltransferase